MSLPSSLTSAHETTRVAARDGYGQGRARCRSRLVLLRSLAALTFFCATVALVHWAYWPSAPKHEFHWSSLCTLSRPWRSAPTFTTTPSPHRFESSLLLTYKTGSSVLYRRAPLAVAHLAASRLAPPPRKKEEWHEYIPNQLFYSDAQALIGDTHFADALANVSREMQAFEGFEEYGRIHRLLSNGLDPSHDLPSGSASPGWKLDKFKFLPLHADAARRFPDVKYTISIEDDTFLFWNQVVKWLQSKDRQGRGADEVKLWGAPTILVNGSIPFTHGGSGYILSRGLVQETFGRSPWLYEHNETFAHYLRYSCCGDAELSRSFQLSLPGFRPNFDESGKLFSGEPLSRLTFVPSEWCEPLLSLHRITGHEYAKLHDFKRRVEPLIGPEDWLRRIDLWDGLMPHFLRGKVYTDMTTYHERDERTETRSGVVADGWHAVPDDGTNAVASATSREGCQGLCDQDRSCLVWTYDKSAERCLHSSNLYIGITSSTSLSGYQTWRINERRSKQVCAGRLGDLAKAMAR